MNKNDDSDHGSDLDDGNVGTLASLSTRAFLRSYAPDRFDKLQMKRLVKRDIIIQNPTVQWRDIANLVMARLCLQEAITLALLTFKERLALQTLVPHMHHIDPPPCKGILLEGPPGTGKTMLAKAVATERNLTFFDVGVSTLTSKFFGRSENLVKILFDEARARAPSVIFIDEIDSLCSPRDKLSEHEATRRMKTELLSQMDDVLSALDPTRRVVILGASNAPWNIDNEFLRRLKRRIYVPLPNAEDRVEMLTRTLCAVEVSADVDLKVIADQLDGYSSSDIVAVCRDAAIMPMRKEIKGKTFRQIKAMLLSVLNAQGQTISMQDLQEAISGFQKTISSAAYIKKIEQ